MRLPPKNFLKKLVFHHVVTDYGQTCGQALPPSLHSTENTAVTATFSPKKQKNKAEKECFRLYLV